MSMAATAPSDEGEIALVCSEDFAQAPERLRVVSKLTSTTRAVNCSILPSTVSEKRLLEMFRRAKRGCNFVIDKMTKAFDAKMADKAMRDDSSDSDDDVCRA